MANAAAPSRPTAWVARAAAPGNSVTDGEPVGSVPFAVALGDPEEKDAKMVVEYNSEVMGVSPAE